jgi:CMP-2-keto-3-deoxyoctulosonic acid synthetase
MSSVKVSLKHPFDFGERKVTDIELNRLKGKHLRKLSGKPTMNDLMQLASVSAAEPDALFDLMDAEDIMSVAEVIGDFLGGSLQTGGKH